MNTADKIAFLFKHVGSQVEVKRRKKVLWFIPVVVSEGWLWIDDNGTAWSVFKSSHRSHHQPLWGPAYAVDIRKSDGERQWSSGNFTGAYKSALSMLPVRNEDEARAITERITTSVDTAYDWYLTQAVIDTVLQPS